MAGVLIWPGAMTITEIIWHGADCFAAQIEWAKAWSFGLHSGAEQGITGYDMT